MEHRSERKHMHNLTELLGDTFVATCWLDLICKVNRGGLHGRHCQTHVDPGESGPLLGERWHLKSGVYCPQQQQQQQRRKQQELVVALWSCCVFVCQRNVRILLVQESP